ncbi:MAG: hypothetical protein ACKOW9_00155 [Candidatus Paceibacterota bacterium]
MKKITTLLTLTILLSACSSEIEMSSLDTRLNSQPSKEHLSIDLQAETVVAESKAKESIVDNDEKITQTVEKTTPAKVTKPSIKPAKTKNIKNIKEKTGNKQVAPTPTKSEAQLPTQYVLYQKYPWEEDPTRYGIPYTDKKPDHYVKTVAIFNLPGDKLLVVRADLVQSRTASLYSNTVGSYIEETPYSFLVYAKCADGSAEMIESVKKTAWFPGQTPSTFFYTDIYEEGPACLN